MFKGLHLTTSFTGSDDWGRATLRFTDPGNSFSLTLERSNTHCEIAEKLETLAKSLRQREEEIRNDR